MLKKQIILSCVESKNYEKEGTAEYVNGGILYHVGNVDGKPTVTGIEPVGGLSDIAVIVRM